ncbi:MAG: S8 family serine peptidase, partial [Chloroflexi bacterium]|nr:S8 family serine peptidase [Chloroflexota bacterium]
MSRPAAATVVLLGLLLAMPTGSLAAEGAAPKQPFIVVLDGAPDAEPGVAAAQAAQRTAARVDEVSGRHAIALERRFDHLLAGFSANLTAGQVQALIADPDVAAVVPDEAIALTAQSMPTGVARVGGRTSPAAKIDGSDERVNADVAVVDTGIDPSHPDLNVAGGQNCTTSNAAAWADGNGHGTHVAGTIAAKDNTIGVVGVAPGARLWAVRILASDGTGLLSWYICGLDWIAAQRDPTDASRPLFEAVNMSVAKWGTDDGNCGATNGDLLHAAVCRLVASGVTVVAAAANDSGSAAKRVPAAYDEVITVSALADTDGRPGGLGGDRCYSWGTYDVDDTFADFSNYGADVDLIAPGKCIWSTKPGDTYGWSSGTSMAAPHVTGAVALYKASRPAATPAEVKRALQYLGTTSWATATDPDATHERVLDVSRIGPLGGVAISPSPAAVGVTQAGGTLPVTLTLARATVLEELTLSVSGVPAGMSASLDATKLFGFEATTATLGVTVPSGFALGSYPLTVTASWHWTRATATVTVVVRNPPGAPTAVAGTPGDAEVTVSWAAPASNGGSAITGYAVTASPGGRTCTSTTAIGCTVTGLTNGTAYSFSVRATNVAGTGPASTPSVPVAPSWPTAVSRLAGADRYTTSAAVSKATFGPGVPVAYIATGL